ncbi:ComF family protein [Psychrobacter sp. P11G3]|uniref:ComF family protein n=1 Tax=Psychrobacter sp. P11G3 TaxID=1699623 RepID=UPI00070F3346|nr:ComF family protein [Psychrobacter sp. P11G3]KRG35901.1 competence protein F [Psychrobacter sp. P11G3]
MHNLAPYQTGLWLAEYIDRRCQLCRIYRSTPASKLIPHHALSNANHSLSSKYESTKSKLALVTSDALLTRTHQIGLRLSSGLLCTHCHHSIAWLPDPFNVDIAFGKALSIQASTYYDYPIRQAIWAFKHHEDMTKLPLLLHVIRQLPRPHGCHQHNSVIVAMPTTDKRLAKRGFDPVSILSAQLSKHWNIPLWHGVQRIDDTMSQQGLTRAERLSNLDDAFALSQSPPVKRLLLFDDVSTTGASLQALARAFIRPDHSNTINAQRNSNYHISAYALAHGSQ